MLRKRRVALVIALVVAAATSLFGRGLADASPRTAAVKATNASGVTVAIGAHKAHMLRPPSAHQFNMVNGPLLYSGGPVMATGVTNTIVLWNPGHLQNGAATGYSAKYSSLAKQWFADQASSPLYANNNQYFQVVGATTTYIQSNNKPPKVLIDKDAFPTGQCTHPHTGANCITDANIVSELRHLASLGKVLGGISNEYFVLTPSGEGSCFDTGCAFPSYTYYCAYHSFATTTPTSTTDMVYANMPYPTDPGGFNCYGPSGQTYPSGDTNADANVNVMSHEQYESVTDPLLNAWKDTTGSEIGDVCAWQFGGIFPSGGDLQINGHAYDTQSEGDNHNLALGGTGCVYAGP